MIKTITYKIIDITTIVLITLKLSKGINWGWGWVFSPLIIFILFIIFDTIKKNKNKIWQKFNQFYSQY